MTHHKTLCQTPEYDRHGALTERGCHTHPDMESLSRASLTRLIQSFNSDQLHGKAEMIFLHPRRKKQIRKLNIDIGSTYFGCKFSFPDQNIGEDELVLMTEIQYQFKFKLPAAKPRTQIQIIFEILQPLK